MGNEVLTEVEGGIMVVTINRPETRNAINRAVALGIAAAMDELDGNDDIRVGILTGAGGSFCSGMDLKAFISGEVPYVEGRGAAGIAEAPPRKPLIAAVEGYALAGGCELALVCDLIVAAEDVKFGIPEVKRGLAAGGGGLLWLPRQIPPRIAMELALVGNAISAGRAYELGLINAVTTPGASLAKAREIAAEIATNGPLAVARSKEVMQSSVDWSREELFPRQTELLTPVFTSKDAIEGATAFAEKRAPQWKGH